MPAVFANEEVVKTVLEARSNGMSYDKIAKMLNEKLGLSTNASAILAIYNREMGKIGATEYTGMTSSETIENLIKNKTDKIEMIVNNLDDIIDYINRYKVKMINWLDKLDIDLQQYYKNVKQEQDGLMKIRQISDIQDAILKTKAIIQADINNHCRMLETYMHMFEAMKPGEVKIDKLDMNFIINQQLTNIEKLGYIMINPKTKEFAELLENAEKKGEVAILKKITTS